MESLLTSAGPFDSSELALNQYSLLISNLSGKVRQERMDGRDYIVAPLTMICPGVLSGSKGPLYYPLSEISRNADAWNNIPITKGHPQKEDGSPCSARSPRVLEKVGIGTVFNAQVNGKLIAEGWFDVEKTKRVSPSTYNKLVKGEVEELSTGLFTDNEPVKNLQDASFNGKAYTHTARNYRPDHLAILPDSKGACSKDDGCGVNVNESTEELASDEELEPFLDFEEPEMKQWHELVSNDASCGSRCKCKDCKKKNKVEQPSEDAYSGNQWTELLENAFCPTGKGGGVDPSCGGKGGSSGEGKGTGREIRSAVEKAIGVEFEDTTSKTIGNRTSVVKGMFGLKGSAAKKKVAAIGEVLRPMGFKEFQGRTKNETAWSIDGAKHVVRATVKSNRTIFEVITTNNQLILNRRVNVKKTEMIAELIANCSCWEKEDEAALNAMPEAKLKSFFDHHTEHQQAQELIDNMDEEEDEEEDPMPPKKKGKGKMPPQFAKNEEIEPVTPSVQNADRRLTPEERADIQWARSERERITNELIEQITSNENNPFTEEYLKSRSREELQGLAKLASNSAKPVTTNSAPARMQVLNFGGVAPGYTKNLGEDFAHQDQDMIPDPIDWASN